MSAPPTNTHNAIEDQALQLFKEAIPLMRDKRTKYTQVNYARPKLYAAEKKGTLAAFMAVAPLFHKAKSEHWEIRKGLDKVNAAVKKLTEAGIYPAAAGGAARVAAVDIDTTILPQTYAGPFMPAPPDAGQKRAAAEISDQILISDDEEAAPPKKTQAAAGGISKPSNAAGKAPAKEMEYAFDNDTKQWDEAVQKRIVLLKDKKVYNMTIMSTKAFYELRTLTPVAAAMCLQAVIDETNIIPDVNAYVVKTAHNLRNQFALDTAETILKQQGVLSDSEDEDKGSDEESEADEVVWAGRGNEWHDDVCKVMDELDAMKKCSFTALDSQAKNELRTLPLTMAIDVLEIVRNEFFGSDVNSFIVGWAQHRRNLYCVDDAKTILEQWKAADKAEKADGQTESDDSEEY